MTAAETLAKVRADFAAGHLRRDEYWRFAAECYEKLRERTPLDPRGPIKAIHVDGDEMFVELRDGVMMWWDPKDVRTVPNILLNHGVYERTELEALSALADSASVVFDIGANVGWYSVNLGLRVGPRGGRVFAFEPIPSTYATLDRNVLLNGLADVVTLLPLGLADAAREATFFLPSETGSVAASQRQLFEREANTKVTARIERLDDVVKTLGVTRIDLIKCDIEGGELLMLRGAAETIRQFRPVLFLELLRKWSRAFGYHPNDVIGLLAAEGYRCWAITDGGLELLERMDDACMHTNFLFVSEQHEPTRLQVDARIRAIG